MMAIELVRILVLDTSTKLLCKDRIRQTQKIERVQKYSALRDLDLGDIFLSLSLSVFCVFVYRTRRTSSGIPGEITWAGRESACDLPPHTSTTFPCLLLLDLHTFDRVLLALYYLLASLLQHSCCTKRNKISTTPLKGSFCFYIL